MVKEFPPVPSHSVWCAVVVVVPRDCAHLLVLAQATANDYHDLVSGLSVFYGQPNYESGCGSGRIDIMNMIFRPTRSSYDRRLDEPGQIHQQGGLRRPRTNHDLMVVLTSQEVLEAAVGCDELTKGLQPLQALVIFYNEDDQIIGATRFAPDATAGYEQALVTR